MFFGVVPALEAWAFCVYLLMKNQPCLVRKVRSSLAG